MDLKKSRVANKSYEALLHLFNLCREHGGLEFEDERKVKCKTHRQESVELQSQRGH
jgi:hypothetical protein